MDLGTKRKLLMCLKNLLKQLQLLQGQLPGKHLHQKTCQVYHFATASSQIIMISIFELG
jgi:hypothetical protein